LWRMKMPTQAKTRLEWGTSTAGGIPLWFAQQQVNVLRHDYIAINVESVTAPHPLQGRLEGSSAFVGGEQTMAVVTAKSDKMTLPGLVEAR